MPESTNGDSLKVTASLVTSIVEHGGPIDASKIAELFETIFLTVEKCRIMNACEIRNHFNKIG
ncbi:MAG: hypothetical protein SOR75_00820 [Synergistes jonesii]|uniref:hypothetical protein n=1 Tax=Synergistes jonesii TaxID=2754 RepID=UPI002A74DC02|nr:hypothetical protein [Synergistes jonesii]MDY2983857.1 hypothetical protein [Synergistes jonesii]